MHVPWLIYITGFRLQSKMAALYYAELLHCTEIDSESHSNGLFPLPDSDSDTDTDSYTMQILWERDLNLSQWKHVLHNTM